MISLPFASSGAITMYDMNGRLAGRVWAGHLNAGDNFMMLNVPTLPVGQYIMHLSVEGIGTLDRKIILLK